MPEMPGENAGGLRVLPRPHRIGEQRCRTTNGKQTGEVATGNGHGSLRGDYTSQSAHRLRSAADAVLS